MGAIIKNLIDKTTKSVSGLLGREKSEPARRYSLPSTSQTQIESDPSVLGDAPRPTFKQNNPPSEAESNAEPKKIEFPELKPKKRDAKEKTESKSAGMDNLIASVLTDFSGDEKDEEVSGAVSEELSGFDENQIGSLLKGGFFKKLHKHIEEKRLSRDEIQYFVKHNLIDMMQKYHSGDGSMIFDHDDYKNSLNNKMEELSTLETEWANSRSLMEKLQGKMKEKEDKMEKTISELKDLMQKQNVYQIEQILGKVKEKAALEVHTKKEMNAELKKSVKEKVQELSKPDVKKDYSEDIITNDVKRDVVKDAGTPKEENNPNAFFMKDGTVVNSFDELLSKLPSLSNDVVSFHTAQDNHHISMWIENTLKNKELASFVQRCNSKEQLMNAFNVN